MSIVSEEDLREIVEVVWMTVLEMPIDHEKQLGMSVADNMTARIRISGAWDGVVLLKASEAFMTHSAALMFDCAAEDVSDVDRSDTLTELTNMLGGTVKCLLPETCDLSLPIILSDDAVDKIDHEWVEFSCEGRPLAVAVIEQSKENQEAA